MKTFDVEEVLAQLTISEKVELLSGTDLWHTKSIPRLSIPAIRATDGPNGARGTRFFNGVPAACFPCGTAMGATWDTDLMRIAGELMGDEVKAKGGHVLLGPTVNIQRSPLGGRGFESFSEDPTLSGSIASAIVKGVQSKGVAATIKHYVCNDQEHERMSVNAVVTERALREIYLRPFQIVQREASPKAYMTAYNKVNGTHASENKKLITDILRNEWKFDGLVMSDWFGLYSAAEAVNAGLDLEMPGPPRLRGDQIMYALNSKKLSMHAVESCVSNVLRLVNYCCKLGIPENAPEGTINTPETASLLRRVASSSIVLLKNKGSILPFKKEKRIAVIGPNAKFATYSGGGSASLRPYYAITPYDAIKNQCKKVEYTLGAIAQKNLPELGNILRTTDGRLGCNMKFYKESPTSQNRTLLDELHVENTSIFLADWTHPQVEDDLYYADLEGTLTPEHDGIWDFGLTVRGTAQLFVDGELIVDNLTHQRSGNSFFGSGTVEERGSINLKAGRRHNFLVRFGSAPTSNYKTPSGVAPLNGGVNFGGFPRIDPEIEIQRAVKLAREVNQVVVCVGLNSEFESEGFDRSDMDLPGHINELILAIASVNANTAVVLQSGTPVTMPWIDEVKAVLQAWYGGNEYGNSIADVLFGTKNPSGKLSLSIPVRCEDNPAFLTFRSERGRVLYGEDVYVGYRFYEKAKRDVLFPFGHGLSYTTFEMKNLRVQKNEEMDKLEISVDIKNTGTIDGEQVVQVYVSQVAPSVQRPDKELRGFKKVMVPAGINKIVTCTVSLKYATSWWDEERDMWVAEKDGYRVLVGDSSANISLEATFELEKSSWWLGV
ncbi:glycoside hydrolase family 3 protein [Glonium stellatum]|uniref:beta-glucosidase n=1 Tax=Glonium stellatum TaxID=574774 RepID=A0A8E2EV26_9PEZI|nr:glycoside hydrolase family 3 protein [Glonium stellatum]